MLRFASWCNVQRLHLPGAVLLLLLERTPFARVAAGGESRAVLSGAGAVLRNVWATVASLGAVQALAGATQFVISRASPITGTVGQSLAPVAFTYTGTPSPPASFRITGALPPGLSIAGLAGGIVNSGHPSSVERPPRPARSPSPCRDSTRPAPRA